MYFRKFPKVQVDVKGDGNLVTMTDITRRIKFTESTLNFRTRNRCFTMFGGNEMERCMSRRRSCKRFREKI